ncbi:MAG: hypothetical protein V4482_03750 [Pseudomonadota bacterium]
MLTKNSVDYDRVFLLIVGNKAIQESMVKYKNRRTGAREMIALSAIDTWIDGMRG